LFAVASLIPTHVSASEPDKVVVNIETLIPKKMLKGVKDTQKSLIEDGAIYGVLESVSFLSSGSSEESAHWKQQFENGTYRVTKVVPIYDLQGNLAEVMVIINDGYVITDALSGEVVQMGFSGVDPSYFEDKAAIYVHGLEHYSVNDAGVVVDGSQKGKSIAEVKQKLVSKMKQSDKKVNKKWGSLKGEAKQKVWKDFLAGANEGTSESNYITDPQLWLLRWYPYNNDGIKNLSVTETYSYSLYVPEILQSNWGPKENDCAVISTLEIMGYHWSLTSTQRTTAYNAMINSSYFVQPDGGVYPWDNDQLFKVGAESIGKPTQQTSDDPEDYSPAYSDIKTYLQTYGPGYLSMGYNDDPYVDHTVTVKGVREFKTTFTDKLYINRTYYDNFLRINDHWSVTSSDAYVKYRDDATWYYVAVVKN
jgi:hypothetical protein